MGEKRKLRNGAEVLASVWKGEVEIALCKWESNPPCIYVTWEIAYGGSARGHYFKTYQEAWDDYVKRADSDYNTNQ